MGSPYRYAVVWSDVLDTALGEGQQGYGEGAAMGQATMEMGQAQQQQGPGQARTPLGIRQRREEGGRVMYLVGFWEGGPERWMGGEELRGEGGGALVEEWGRRYQMEGE